MHIIHMKRTTMVLDEKLLDQAVRLLGTRTRTAAVEQALREAVQRASARRLLTLAGSGAWKGDLAEMRGDSPRRPA